MGISGEHHVLFLFDLMGEKALSRDHWNFITFNPFYFLGKMFSGELEKLMEAAFDGNRVGGGQKRENDM